MDKILSDWLQHNLRKNRPYINFTFESDELLLDSINMLDMSEKEAKYIDGYSNEDFEKSRLEYVNYSMNNIKNVLEHLFTDDTIITVYSNKNFFITPFANLEDYSLNYLKSKILMVPFRHHFPFLCLFHFNVICRYSSIITSKRST